MTSWYPNGTSVSYGAPREPAPGVFWAAAFIRLELPMLMATALAYST